MQWRGTIPLKILSFVHCSAQMQADIYTNAIRSKQKQEEKKERCFLPRQIVPFPVKPSLQTQAYEPMLL